MLRIFSSSALFLLITVLSISINTHAGMQHDQEIDKFPSDKIIYLHDIYASNAIDQKRGSNDTYESVVYRAQGWEYDS